MKEEITQSHCATCDYNVGNICKSHAGYYLYGEVISDEEVECEDWLLNPYAYPVQLNKK